MQLIRIVIILFVAAAVIGLLRTALPEPWWNRLLLPYRVAKLAATPADERLLMPVGTLGTVRDTWQAPRPPARRHEGQDIFAPRGTPVFSATEGIVLRIGDGGIGGKTVSVVGAGGRTYYYAHLHQHAPGLYIGALVTPATVLGTVGNTGNARTTPPHLHFGVYTAIGAINPLPMLVDRSRYSEVSRGTEEGYATYSSSGKIVSAGRHLGRHGS